MEASNVPDELLAKGVTSATADHTKQISDYGVELGGPLMRDKAWFYGSYSTQDVQLVRRSGSLVDETKLNNPNLKVNWQATAKTWSASSTSTVQDQGQPQSRHVGHHLRRADSDVHQDNAYTDNPLHGLFKIADDRVLRPNMFLTAKYAYFNTGFLLTPEGAWACRPAATSRSGNRSAPPCRVRTCVRR